MGKNKQDINGITEANAEAELKLTDLEVRALLDRIDEGHTPTDAEIAALKKVESIVLYRIPKSIDLLTNLQLLNFHKNQIGNLSGIEKLTDLQMLYLSETSIDSNELKMLSKLKKLRFLYLMFLKLTKIPSQLLELNLPFITKDKLWHQYGIFLYGTELTLQPLSLFEQNRELI